MFRTRALPSFPAPVASLFRGAFFPAMGSGASFAALPKEALNEAFQEEALTQVMGGLSREQLQTLQKAGHAALRGLSGQKGGGLGWGRKDWAKMEKGEANVWVCLFFGYPQNGGVLLVLFQDLSERSTVKQRHSGDKSRIGGHNLSQAPISF